MAGLHKSEFQNPVLNWVDSRMPVFTMMQKEYGSFPTPKNFNYFWNFGALAMVTLAIMIATGIFLAMNYTPNTTLAFDSVERIMRDVPYGWLLRYVHANGASMFFIVTYIHIFRAFYYGSYKAPRELLFMLGVVILLLMMATAFMGYVLALGADELLGRHRHHQPVLRHPARRRQHRDLAVGRVLGGQPHAEPVLRAALPDAVHDRRRGVPAHRGAAHHRVQQPAGYRREDPAGHHPVPPVLHDQGQRGAVPCSC